MDEEFSWNELGLDAFVGPAIPWRNRDGKMVGELDARLAAGATAVLWSMNGVTDAGIGYRFSGSVSWVFLLWKGFGLGFEVGGALWGAPSLGPLELRALGYSSTFLSRWEVHW